MSAARPAAAGGSPLGATTGMDVVVVGAGIVRMATALRLLERSPKLRVTVVDKERQVGAHQTGHNSGVVHRGIYYAEGSLKARLCVSGARRILDYCDARSIPYRLVGKLVIAAHPRELPALRELGRRAAANGVPRLAWVEGAEIAKIEPNAVGVAALHSPDTGIVDFGQVALSYARDFQTLGGELRLGYEVTKVIQTREGAVVESPEAHLSARLVVSCAGLHSDRIAAHVDRRGSDELRIVPFRGDYYVLRPGREELVRGLIYPVPDPDFPFLGVHFTPRMDGSVWVGPNAVLAFSREGYRLTEVNLRDLAETITFGGFWRLARRYWRVGAHEMWLGVSKRAFAAALRRYVPHVSSEDLSSYASGVRAQAVGPDGRMVDDFAITATAHTVTVRNAPSPAATSSLAIGDHLADLALRTLGDARC